MQKRVARLGQLVVMGLMATMLTGFDGGGCGGGFQTPQGCPAIACDESAGCRPELNADGCAFCVCERPTPPPPDRCAGLDEERCIARPGCQPIYDAGPAPRPDDPNACMPAPSYAGCESTGQACPDVMCAMWCEYGYVKDANGCDTCACRGGPCASDAECAPGEYCDFSGGRAVPPCPPGERCEPLIAPGVCRPQQACDQVMCEMYCEYGFQRDPATGCAICACNPPPRCEPVTCRLYCEYGWQTDPATGCEICACNPPPQCPPLACRMNCPYGLEQDANGCDTCVCKPPPSEACRSDGDCRPGQECQWPPTCAGLNCPQPTAGRCTDVVCSTDADCAPGSSCQLDPNDPCNQPGVVCTHLLPARMICLPKPPPPPPTCNSDADCGRGTTCQPDPTDPCNGPDIACFAPGRRICLPPPAGCTSDADCGPGQRCEPGVTCAALGCPPPVNFCVDNTCNADSDCRPGTTCQPDPTDPCNGPDILCFAPGRQICLPEQPKCESITDERTCSTTPGCKPTWGTPCPPGMVCPQVIRFACLPACDGLSENACLARADCQAVYGPSTCTPDGSICTTDMVFKGCK